MTGEAREELPPGEQYGTPRLAEYSARAMLDSLPFDFWAMDAHGRYIVQNALNVRHWGDLTGKTVAALPLTPRMRAIWKDQDRRAMAGEVVDEEYAFVRDGCEIVAHKTLAPFYLDGKVAGVVCVSVDITERKRIEQEIIEISSREQRRIGRDLHDGLGQELTGILCLSRGVANDLTAEKSIHAAASAEIVELVRHAMVTTRRLAHGLRPVEFEAEGLADALRQLTSTTELLHRVSCVMNAGQAVLVHDSAQAEHLYRIAQEAVTNALKHGKARHIRISLSAQAGRGRLVVENDGKPLPKKRDGQTGLGVRIMAYRAKTLGGELQLDTAPDGRVVLQCSFTLESK